MITVYCGRCGRPSDANTRVDKKGNIKIVVDCPRCSQKMESLEERIFELEPFVR